MERVQTLSNKLHEQLARKAPVDELLLTIDMLRSELLHLQSNEPVENTATTVSIDVSPVFEKRSLRESS